MSKHVPLEADTTSANISMVVLKLLQLTDILCVSVGSANVRTGASGPFASQ